MTNIEVRNRLGVVVCTFNDLGLAFKFARERRDLGTLNVWRVTTTTHEQRLEEAPVIPMRGARGLMAGRGR